MDPDPRGKISTENCEKKNQDPDIFSEQIQDPDQN